MTINTKNMNVSYLGMALVVAVAATLEDYCTAAGITQDDVVDQLNGYHVARTPASMFRKQFLEEVEAQTDIKRARKTVGEGENAKEGFDETEKEYFDRICATDEYSVESFTELATTIAAGINWVPSASTGRIGKEWETQAENLLATIGDDAEKMAKVVANLGSKGVSVNVGETGFPVVRELAGAMKAFNTIKLREAQDELLG